MAGRSGAAAMVRDAALRAAPDHEDLNVASNNNCSPHPEKSGTPEAAPITKKGRPRGSPSIVGPWSGLLMWRKRAVSAHHITRRGPRRMRGSRPLPATAAI